MAARTRFTWRRSRGVVKVYHFKFWDKAGMLHYPARKATAERIAAIRGQILTGTEEDVDASLVHEGRYDPERKTLEP